MNEFFMATLHKIRSTMNIVSMVAKFVPLVGPDGRKLSRTNILFSLCEGVYENEVHT